MGEERERGERKRKKDGVVEDWEKEGEKKKGKEGEGGEGSVNQMLDHFKIGLAPKGCHGN